MQPSIKLYSNTPGDIYKFLKHFYFDITKENIPKEIVEWQKHFENPIEIADMIGVCIDNNNKYDINVWINLDENISINVTNSNVTKIIKYLFERYPY